MDKSFFHPEYRLCDIVSAVDGWRKFNEIIVRGQKAGYSAQQAIAKYIEHNNLDAKINAEKALREEEKRQKDARYMQWLEKNSDSKNTWSGVSK